MQNSTADRKTKFRLKWTLKIKFITFTTLLIVVIMMLNGMLIIIREKRLLMDKVVSESSTLVKSLAIPITNVFLYQDVGLLHEEELLESYILQIMEEKKWPVKYAIILDNKNRVLVHSDLKEFGKIYSDPVTMKSTASWETITQKFYHPRWGPVLDASTPLAISSKRWGTLRVGFSLAPIQSRIAFLYWEIIGITFGLALLGFIVVNYLSKRLTAPLSLLTDEMKKTSVDQQHGHISIHSSDEIGYLARTFEDMRERLIASHQELKQVQNQIVQAEKLASIGRLASGVAHEINNPLNGIQNCVRMIIEEPGNVEQTKKYLNLIDEGLNKIETVVKKLLNYARRDKLNRVKFDINNSVKKMISLLDYKISSRSIETVLTLDQTLPPVTGDANLIEQALLNLMINAYDAMPHGGQLKIMTTRKNKGVTISVEDTGVGIPESALNKIFDPFYTTKDVGEGTGLGLSVCLGIIETHHGKIQVSSKQGKGTTFKVFIPYE